MSHSALKDLSALIALGNLCDDVLLAIYERVQGPLEAESLRKIEAAANYFAGLSVLLAHPLNLSESLPHIDKLDIVKYLDARGSSLDYTMYAIEPSVATLGSHADTRGESSKKMSRLLRALAGNELSESEVSSVREALSNLAHKLTLPGRMSYT